MRIPKKVLHDPSKKTYDTIEYNPRIGKNKKGRPITIDQYKAVFAFRKANGEWDKETKSCPSKDDAKHWIRERHREHEKKGTAMEHRGKLLHDYAENDYKPDFLAKLASERTETQYVDAAVAFFGKDMPLDGIRTVQLRRYKRHLEDGDRGARSVAAYLVRLRALLRQAEADEYIVSAPSFKGLIPSSFPSRKETFTMAEYLKLLDACEVVRHGRKREHLRPVLIGLHELGCRPVELHNILVKDIDLSVKPHGIVKVWSAKRHAGAPPQQRNVPITARLRNWIDEKRIMERPADAKVFGHRQDLKRAWAAALDIAGIKRDVVLYDLRHTAITNASEGGMNDADKKAIFGHSTKSKMTDDVYTNQRVSYLAEQMAKVDEVLALKEREARAQALAPNSAA